MLLRYVRGVLGFQYLFNRHPFAAFGAFDCSEDHGEGFDVVVAFAFGGCAGFEGVEEFAEGAGDAAWFVDGDCVKGADGAVEAFVAFDQLSLDLTVTVPFGGSVGAHRAPFAFPAGVEPVGAPGASIVEFRATFHLEQASRR